MLSPSHRLAKRYGPILTVKFISPSVLKLLALCYSEKSHMMPEVEEVSFCFHLLRL